MNHSCKFAIGQRVRIKDCDNIEATIREIKINLHGITYFLTYFLDGKLQEIFLWESELSET